MTEVEWLTLKEVPELGTDADQWVVFSRRRASLFATACARATPGVSGQRRPLRAVKEVETAAESGNWVPVDQLGYRAEVACEKTKRWSPPYVWAQTAVEVTFPKVEATWPNVAHWLGRAAAEGGPSVRRLKKTYLALMREVFGNPFRHVACSPEWHTSTAVAIAQGMYESRDFGAMPILADALQDAGCDNDDVLNHCRGPGPHVRGCWVVDLVLGKE